MAGGTNLRFRTKLNAFPMNSVLIAIAATGPFRHPFCLEPNALGKRWIVGFARQVRLGLRSMV
jgi:hypothetical protein